MLLAPEVPTALLLLLGERGVPRKCRELYTAALHTPHPQFACTHLGCEGTDVSRGKICRNEESR